MIRLLVLSDSPVDQSILSTHLQNAVGTEAQIVSRLYSEVEKSGAWGDVLLVPFDPHRSVVIRNLCDSFRPVVVIGLLNRRTHSATPEVSGPYDGFHYVEQLSSEALRPWMLLAKQRITEKGPKAGELRILVAQSGALIHPVVADVARRTGASVTTVSDMPALSMMAESQNFSLVVVDTQLPNFQTPHDIRSVRAAGRHVVAMVSSGASDTYRRELQETADSVIPLDGDAHSVQNLVDKLQR